MARGRPKKVKAPEVKETEVLDIDGTTEAPKNEADMGVVLFMQEKPPVGWVEKPKFADKPVDPWDAAIAESRKLLDVPLAAGQAYYESPEGFIMIDDAERGRAWCRQADKGKGQWINPRR